MVNARPTFGLVSSFGRGGYLTLFSLERNPT